jgi:hypothetical protein
MMLLMRAKEIPFSDDILFVDHNVYNWKIDYDIYMSAYYVPDLRNEGVEAYHRLHKNRHAPQWIMNSVENNKKFWVSIGLL